MDLGSSVTRAEIKKEFTYLRSDEKILWCVWSTNCFHDQFKHTSLVIWIHTLKFEQQIGGIFKALAKQAYKLKESVNSRLPDWFRRPIEKGISLILVMRSNTTWWRHFSLLLIGMLMSALLIYSQHEISPWFLLHISGNRHSTYR